MIPDWKLERFLVNNLSKAEMEDIRREELSDEFLHARLETLRKKNAEFFEKHPADLELFEIRSKAEGRKVVAKRYYKPLLVAALFLIVLMPVFAPDILPLWKKSTVEVSAYTEDGLRVKGLAPRFEVWKKTQDSAVILTEKSEVRAGDELQVRYLVPEKCYGMIFSMDGRGSVTFHLSDGGSALSLEPGKMRALDFAYKLDDAPYFEKFYFLVSANRFTLDVKNLDSLLKDKGIRVESLSLRKADKGWGK
ncbi:MAG: hypothetical protein M0P13_08390 [Fibrobacteraceae bacterium]|nr:hypothetical protein [Fibrobacteraceae bacterium]